MKKLLVVTLATMIVLTMTMQVMVQGDTSALSGAAVGRGPRSAAMGGAFVAVADDATALYWNPAGLTNVTDTSWTNSVVGRAENLDVADEAKDVYDIVKELDITPGDFDFIRTQAQQLAGKPVGGNATAISAVAFPNVALGVYGIGGGLGELQYTAGTGTGYVIDGVEVYEGEAVSVTGSALWQTSTAAAFSYDLNDRLAVGAAVRKMNLRYRDKDWQSVVAVSGTPPLPEIVTSEAETPTAKDEATVVDLGLMYAVEPRVRLAAVVRNLTSPNFALKDSTGQVVARYNADAVIDLGLAVSSADGKHLAAFDVHNIGGRNGDSSTIHVGYEWQASSLLAIRIGGTQSTLTSGIGLDLGFLQFDFAIGTGHNDTQQAGAAINFEF